LGKFSHQGSVLDDDICTFLASMCLNATREDVEDLLFSLMPELCTLDERKIQDIIDALAQDTSLKATVFPSVERGLEMEPEPDHEHLATFCSILAEHGYADSKSCIDSATLFYLLNIWVGIEVEDRLNMVKSYVDIDSVENPETLLTALLVFFERFAIPEDSIEEIKTNSEESKAKALEAAVEAISSDKREKRELTEEELKQRKQLVKKHGYGIDQPKFDEKGKPTKSKPVVLFVENEKLTKSKQRYRESKVVATKGEKYIVEKEEEYDSGCRGRVKGKGKRGPGVGKGL